MKVKQIVQMELAGIANKEQHFVYCSNRAELSVNCQEPVIKLQFIHALELAEEFTPYLL